MQIVSKLMVLALFNAKNPKMPSRLSEKVNNFAAETREKAVLPLPSPIVRIQKALRQA